MKKMSVVFELPIVVLDEDVTDFEGLSLCAVDSSGDYDGAYFWGGCDEEKAQYAAHAINHVDALADALEFLLGLPRGCSGRIIIEKSEETVAIAALKAYRGEA